MRRVRQGDPLSPILFINVLRSLLIDLGAKWEKEKALRQDVRAEHQLAYEIKSDDEQEYNTLLAKMLEEYNEKIQQAMPCYGVKVECVNAKRSDG